MSKTNTKPRTLSKSRFKRALACRTKVYYSLDPRYANEMADDEFMEALAQGGNQVGELAKLMFRAEDPDVIEITARDQAEQVRQTQQLLTTRRNVTLFEGTILHGNLLARVDVLVKRGNRVEIIEVKAKSWDPAQDSLIGTTPRANPLAPAWEEYVYDVAFQERVLALAFPRFTIRPWLMLVDKSAVNSVAGLPLKFPVEVIEDAGTPGRSRSVVHVTPDFRIQQLKQALLVKVDAAEAVQRAQHAVREKKNGRAIDFDQLIAEVATAIQQGERLGPDIGTACKACEYYCAPAERTATNRSGWAECMELRFGQTVRDAREHSVFGFYDQRPDILAFVDAGKLWMRELEEGDLEVKGAAGGKISRSERQALQWREVVHGDDEPVIQGETPREAMARWGYPLHFIDFETAMPALPFHAGHRPYQPLLFQFSHHVVEKSGAVRHASECLITDGGPATSVEVLRQLRTAVGDGAGDGTVLHWYPHERTILKSVRAELAEMRPAPKDKAMLLAFLDVLGLDKDAPRRMFDLGRLFADHVFLPGTGGSSSMKRVLPAVLRHSDMVRKRYSKPVYGTARMPSRNFRDQAWVVPGPDGVAIDPYTLLSPLFGEHELDEALARLEREKGEVVANGTAAMIAYGRLQDAELGEQKQQALRAQLLRYCELDTAAMVMAWEAVSEWIG